ncbi:MAG: alpha-D-ribose 1-methylphosphonate 5-triphosphate diphosphatase [Loktanella sp.]|nr:alpha-D-ribose 1-methylphosphonate 5-triphosphate diphosphatase [Loktanella sp.]
MTDQIILANARLILGDEVITGSLQITDGIITDIGTGSTVPVGAVDLGGDYLAPGLVELHTDNLERHLSPRPKVDWPYRAAIMAHDRELAGCGITTVFDAVRVGSITLDGDKGYAKYARQMADEIITMRAAGALRISHHLHLRAEICSQTLAEELDEFSTDDRIGIISIMDHTPGQRQFADVAKFEAYVRGKRNMSAEDFRGYIDFLYGLQAQLGDAHEAATVAAAQRLGAVLASHDDTTPEQVATSHAHGVRLAEFPTTMEAADACHASDIAVIMGAPNLIRGGSHSGNVAAADLAQADRLDILSSDYVPAALLLAAVRLGLIWDDLPRGIATVTSAPAQAAGLTDRGQLAIGQRADLVSFAMIDDIAMVQQSYAAGRRVF